MPEQSTVSPASVRANAAKNVSQVLAGKAFETKDVPEQKERGLILELSFGTLRYWPQLEAVATYFLSKPFKRKDNDVLALLSVGIYQLLHTRIPDHAAIGETVEACSKIKKAWAKGLLNAVLRNVQRNKDELDSIFSDTPEYFTAHPPWLHQALEENWPWQADAVMAAGNQRPPMDLRVNSTRASIAEITSIMEKSEIVACSVEDIPSALHLPCAAPVPSMTEFSQGLFSIQDRSAQRVASLVDAKSGMRVLDACSAPGGKAAHLLERTPNIDLIAIDISPDRIKSVKETFSRLGLNGQTLVADASDRDSWWDGSGFDRILVDAPCSGTGVIRRHPDIKLLRRANDLQSFAETQKNLLRGLWPSLKSGGLLVYVTCSIMPEENWQVAEAFSAEHSDCEELVIDTEWGVKQPFGRQILPSVEGGDGFYFVRFAKK